MRTRVFHLLVSLATLLIPVTVWAQASNPSSPAPRTIDVLQWMVMQPADQAGSPLASQFHMTGTANPLFSSMQPDRFFWTKMDSGYPWDIQLFDDNFIYLWVTELNWHDATTYKVFRNQDSGNYNLPLAPRFVSLGSTPGKVATIMVKDSTYEVHSSCTNYVTKNLGNVVNEVWGPYSETLGGDLPPDLTTIIISYRYACDAAFVVCKDKEEFHLGYPFGLVHWQHQRWNRHDGQYDPPDNQTTFNHVSAGTVSPSISCGVNFDGQ